MPRERTMERVVVTLVLMAGCGRETTVEPREVAEQEVAAAEGGGKPVGDAPTSTPTPGGDPVQAPVDPAPRESLRATAIAIASGTSYARMSDGTVRAWGDGSHFALGREDAAAVGHPMTIAGVEHATAIFAGGITVAAEMHSTACAPLENGEVVCWGDRRGFPLARSLSIEGVPPTEVPALKGAREITIGASFGCAVMADQTVSCWGDVPGWPSLPVQEHREPQRVDGLSGAISVRAGWSHVCVLVQDGRVLCWGRNNGQQVAPTEERRAVFGAPRIVEDVEGALELAVAQDFSMARRSDGTVVAWGGESVEVSPGRVSPLALGGRAIALSGSAVSGHLCAIVEGGSLSCVGRNRLGQLGSATAPQRATTMFEVPDVADAVAVGTSLEHTCALVRDGNVWCWGGNRRGGLGDGTLDDRAAPRRVEHLLDAELPPPTPPEVVTEGPVEGFEDLPEGCGHPTLALTLPDRDRTTFEVKMTDATIDDDRKTAWIHLRDHGFDVKKSWSFDTPRGDQLHLELVLTRKKFVRIKRGWGSDDWEEKRLRLEKGRYRSFPAWLALDSPNLQPTVTIKLTDANGPVMLEASPVREGDVQEVTITRLGPDWICGTLAITSPRGSLTGDFAARVDEP